MNQDRHARTRESAVEFFSDEENHNKLRRFASEPDSLKMVSFFLGPHYSHQTTRDGQFVHLNDEYKAALSALKKRYFDFTSEAGRKSDLVWEGQVNPPIRICSLVSLPLPALIAMKWFVSKRFDELFWQDFEAIKSQYETHFNKIKTKYTETHKKKKKLARERIARQVIAETKGQNKKGRRVTLTRKQRSIISARLLAEKIEQKERRKNLKLTGKKKETKRPRARSQACACVMKVA